ncbi:unnamed protein product (macronuclear) [Paramecium tetraurelia]|uniref:Acid phosphatase n=1 Tax=Paramecium tetraurelia TaxID=5888 RepID=A0CKD2_PARTE|nr:uncharacterized protein GSPATT00000962001 [Paramecium tetraurelia]CAK71249.1 unnamed protein product [Paramecium tetraurelia]|eukprot:XP_001438646.1 hypothetical protein (macronuclear) [Paramecium tetraurelia strain d4-2]
MILILLILLLGGTQSQGCQPYGIRLFLGHYFSYLRNSQDVIRIVFNTEKECKGQFVLELMDNKKGNQVMASQITYYDTQLLNMTQIYEKSETIQYKYETFIHTFKIGLNNVDINVSTSYNYTIVSKQNSILSGPYKFDIPLAQNEQKFLVFGDMDSNWVQNYSKDTFNWLENQVNSDKRYDSIIFTGDMAYDLETNNCQQGDNWLRNLSVFTNRYPFMAAPGNHDTGENKFYDFFRANFGALFLTEYNTKSYLNDFFSFDVGMVHFIQFNPIKIVYQNDIDNVTPLIVEQMRNDLIHANYNRDKVPWIIVYTHYPIYCSNPQSVQCLNNFKYLSEFEDLFVKYKVDLYLSGHVHTYQRNKPYYKNNIAKYKQQDNIISEYQYPVSIIEGVAGTDFGKQNETFPEAAFMEIQNPNHGIGIITVKNSTHLYYEHITVSDNKVIDAIWLDRSIDTTNTSNHDGFEIVMWVIFSVLLVLTGVSIYYKSNQGKKSKKKLLDETITMVVS